MSTRYNHIKYIGILGHKNMIPDVENITFSNGAVLISYLDNGVRYMTAAATLHNVGDLILEDLGEVMVVATNTEIVFISKHFTAKIDIKSKPCGFEIINYEDTNECNEAVFGELFAWAATQVDVRTANVKMEAL